MKIYTLEELLDKHIGKIGTEERNAYEVKICTDILKALKQGKTKAENLDIEELKQRGWGNFPKGLEVMKIIENDFQKPVPQTKVFTVKKTQAKVVPVKTVHRVKTIHAKKRYVATV